MRPQSTESVQPQARTCSCCLHHAAPTRQRSTQEEKQRSVAEFPRSPAACPTAAATTSAYARTVTTVTTTLLCISPSSRLSYNRDKRRRKEKTENNTFSLVVLTPPSPSPSPSRLPQLAGHGVALAGGKVLAGLKHRLAAAAAGRSLSRACEKKERKQKNRPPPALSRPLALALR